MTGQNGESGNRVAITCSCGNEFSVPPNKRGSWVYCLSCNEETLALDPSERQRMEDERRPSLERHVRAIAFWLAVGGILAGMSGFANIVRHTSPAYLPELGAGDVVEGLVLMLLGCGFLYLSLQVQQHRSWTWPTLRYGALPVILLLPAGWYMEWIPLRPPGMVLLLFALLVEFAVYPSDSRELFTDAYRRIIRTLRGSIWSMFRSVVFWGPLLGLAGALLLSG